jgi:hypothetical protein
MFTHRLAVTKENSSITRPQLDALIYPQHVLVRSQIPLEVTSPHLLQPPISQNLSVTQCKRLSLSGSSQSEETWKKPLRTFIKLGLTALLTSCPQGSSMPLKILSSSRFSRYIVPFSVELGLLFDCFPRFVFFLGALEVVWMEGF